MVLPIFVLLVAVASLACLYAFLCATWNEQYLDRAQGLLRQRYPEIWQALGDDRSQVFNEGLYRQIAQHLPEPDEALNTLVANMARQNRRFWLAAAVGAGSVTGLILLSWRWGWPW